MKGLILRAPFGTLIVEGKKTLEVRKWKTKYRGRVVIIENGFAVGEVDIVDVLGPFTLDELKKFSDLHLAGSFLDEYLKDGKAYVWVLENPEKYDKPKKVNVPKGVVTFVNLD